MRRVAIALILTGLCANPSANFAADSKNAPARTPGSGVPSANLAGVGLGDAIDTLRDITGANIHVNWKLLQEKNINQDTVIHVRLRNVTLRKALQLILDEASGSTPLTFYIDQGVIEITTQEAADAKLITRVYDVGDLIVDIPDFTGPELNLAQNNSGSNNNTSGNGGGGGGTGIFSNTGNTKNDKPATATDRGNELVSLITSTIRPEVWQVNGGPATIRFYRNRLIVTAPRSVQEMIGGRGE